MPASVVTLVLLVDLLGPGRPAETCAPTPDGTRASLPDRTDPLWSIAADAVDRRSRLPTDPEPRPEVDGVTPPQESAWPDLSADGMSAAAVPEGEDEEPICVHESQCSSIPAEHSGVIPSLKSFKGWIAAPLQPPAPGIPEHRGPTRPGEPCRGFAEPPFRPPR